jgi:hypothetical protein
MGNLNGRIWKYVEITPEDRYLLLNNFFRGYMAHCDFFETSRNEPVPGYQGPDGGDNSHIENEPYGEQIEATDIDYHDFAPYNGDRLSSVKKQLKEGSITLQPNPANSIVHISYEGIESGKYTISVLDAIGREILKQDAEVNDNKGNLKINLTHRQPGVYLLRMYNKQNNLVYEERLVITK